METITGSAPIGVGLMSVQDNGRLRLFTPRFGDGLGGLTMSEDGGLERLEAFFSDRAMRSCNASIFCCICGFLSTISPRRETQLGQVRSEGMVGMTNTLGWERPNVD